MKTAWLIVNGYMSSQKFDEIYMWLIRAAKKKGIALKKLPNDQLASIFPLGGGRTFREEKPDFVLFWDKDVKLARILEAEGFAVFNCADAIEVCDDKALTYLRLKNTSIKMPKTFAAPMTFEKSYQDFNFLLKVQETLGYPMILKENKGSFGEQVYLVNNYREAVQKIKEIGHHEFVMQEFIEHSRGRDVRIHVVGDQIVTAMKRTNLKDFRANITNGGTMEPWEPTKEQQQMAIEVCRKLRLDFAGVDLLFGNDEEPLLCEVNSNAHFKNIYDCTGVNVADAIIGHLMKKTGR